MASAYAAPRQVFEAYDRSAHGDEEGPLHGSKCATGGNGSTSACQSCGRIQRRSPSVAVCVLIERDGKVLLGKRSSHPFPGKWALPGGYLEYDEDYLTAARRETKEETGLDVEVTAIVNVVTNYLTPDLHMLAVFCAARPVGGLEAPDDDLSELKWVDLAGPFPPMAFEADEHAIKRFRESGHAGIAADPDFASGLPVAQEPTS